MHYNRLLAVCVISCMFLCSPAFAAGTDSDVSKLGTPTLDSLAGQEIPGSDPVEYYPEDLKSGYTLTEVTPADVENLPQNVITKYEIKEITKYYDPATGAEVAEGDRLPDVEYKEVVTKEAIPHYFEVNLAYTNYGSGAQSIIFNWEVNDDGQYTLKESTDISGSSSIIYHYDGTSHQRVNNTSGDYGDITGNFVKLSGNTNGGAISNSGKLGDINADFINNNVLSTDFFTSCNGGAIYNVGGTIGNITGNFIGNSADGDGGAIYNYGNNNTAAIGNITGDFIGNSASSDGGAIYNYAKGSSSTATIGNITGDFIGNSSGYHGGAIYNDGEIGNITGDFIGNSAGSDGGAIYNNNGTIDDITGDFIGNSSAGDGGAIYNYTKNSNNSTIGNITGDFIGNSAEYSSAVRNDTYQGNGSATIDNITGDFINNIATESNGSGIFNRGWDGVASIGNITGDFINNIGGAIYNMGAGTNGLGIIRNINGDFIGNSGTAIITNQGGGENSIIGNITGDFINNSGRVGVIYNWANQGSATIGGITGDFINNKGYGIDNSGARGVASTGNIIGNFVGNSHTDNSYARGSAVYNNLGKIKNITGDFINNYASATTESLGGAIYHYYNSTIESITGNFINNSAIGAKTVQGGAIYINYISEIGDITGNFIGNHVSGTGRAYGGSIYLFGSTIGQLDDEGNLTGGIYGSFIGNYAETTSGTNLALGGAVFTLEDINFIADGSTIIFKDNYTKDSRGVIPNAIFVQTSSNSSPTISLIANNSGKILFYDQIDGGGVNGGGTTIDHTYQYNLALKGDGTGTISLYNDIINANVSSDNVTVDFVNNETKNYDLVSFNAGENSKLNLDVDLSSKTADTITTTNTSSGTIVINSINFIGATEEAITIQVINNNADDSDLQIALGDNFHSVDNILDSITDNVFNDDVFMQQDGINITSTNTENDSLIIFRDKIYDTLDLIAGKESNAERSFTFQTADTYYLSKDLTTVTDGTLNIKGRTAGSVINANNHTLFDLKNNTALNISNTTLDNAKDFAVNIENSDAKLNLVNSSITNTDGTGILANTDVNISADNGESHFSGNSSAIQMNNADSVIYLNAVNEGKITFDDTINGVEGYSVKIDGDDSASVSINNDIKNAVISLDNTNLYLGRENVFNQSAAVKLNSGSMHLVNNSIGNVHVPQLALNGITNLSVDVDLQNQIMDRVTADNYNISDNALLNVNYLNLISTTEENNVKILFADEQLANNVQYSGDSPVSYKGTNVAYSPIYKYDVGYSVEEDGLGYFMFNRAGGGSGNPSDSFNPSVLSEPVAAQSGGQAVVTETMRFAFQHADTFSILPASVRVSILENHDNRYALTEVPAYKDINNRGFWVRPFTTFESMDLKNGPDVDAVTYGTLIGFDTDFQEFGRGWYGVTSGYVGYNGSSLSYSGVDTILNGGLLGATQTFYKGNFFTALTLTAGASAGSTSSDWGAEDFAMLLAGVASKTGYNFEFREGKIIVQPLLALNYSFVNTFDYTNAQGVSIDSDPLHSMQINPAIRFIGNLKNGWQPYASVGMVWNVLNSSKVTANDVILPKMSVKPYVEYGLGIQRSWAEKFSAFFQAMVRNGGRTGVALTGGFRWAVGEDEAVELEEVQNIYVPEVKLPQEKKEPKPIQWKAGL